MNLCIYHGGCTDGVAAAWAVWSACAADEYHAGVYQQEPPWSLIEEAERVIVVDFSYKRPVMEEIAARTPGRVLVLDHHKTAQEDLAPLLGTGVVDGAFSMEACGALMAWEHFCVGPPPALLMEIDAADRWLPTRNAPLIMALRSWPHAPTERMHWADLMQQWSHFMTDEGTQGLRQDGEAIYRYYRARVDETKPHAALMTIGPYTVPVVNAPYYLASDVAGELAQDAPGGVAAVWWRNSDGGATFSLRSCGEVDVGKLATRFGGGGHPGAAGFKIGALALVHTLDSEMVIVDDEVGAP